MHKYTCLPAIIIATAAITACSQQNSYQAISGETMGTSYHIRYEHPAAAPDMATIQATIDARLEAINDSMSTYREDSTISKFNRLPSATPLTIDADFTKVLTDSQSIYKASHGAFDPTVYPLVQLWGFGSKITVDRLATPPTPAEIATTKAMIGLDKVKLNQAEQGSQITKSTDGVGLDFSAIAKGYAVDVIASVLHDTYGINSYMVEIGGEVATAGVNAKGKPWTLSIDTPSDGSTATSRTSITTLTQPKDEQLHIATSGNYRNFVEYNGVHYSHTINPNTGQPVAGGAPSVTVIHDSVALADGWATALTAVPTDEAIQLADENNIQAIFITQNADKTGFNLHKTKAMQARFHP